MPEVRLRGGDVDGLALHYLVEGRGPVVVLVHGLGGFAASWRHTIAALAPRATVYAVDLPGFGRSAKPRRRYDLGFFARALHGFIDAVGLPRVSLVGHSLGGAIAVTYALTHPPRVERLALLSAVVPGFDFRLSAAYRLLAVPCVGEALALCGSARLYRAALARCFHAPRRDEIEFLVQCDYASRTSWEARGAYLATLRGARADWRERGEDYRRLLRTLDLPILSIHGREDPVVPAAHCGIVAGGLPRVAVRWVERCGHFPHIEHAAVVNEWLGDFLVGRRAAR